MIKLCKKYKIQDNKDGKSSKNVRNKKKLKNDLSDEFLIDNTILEQNPNLINIQDVEQKILKIFKSNLTSNINNKDDSIKFEDNDSEGSQAGLQMKNSNSANGKLFETFKISKKVKNKQKLKPSNGNNMDFSQMNNFLMNNNLTPNIFDHYLSMNTNFQSPKNMNNNLLSLIGMPMDNNTGMNNDLLGLLFQQYQQNNNPLLDSNHLNFAFNPLMENPTNLIGMPLNILLPQVAQNQAENLNQNLQNFNMFNNGNNNKTELEALLKMIYNNQQMNNEPDQAEQIQKINPLQNMNNVQNNSGQNEAKNSLLGQKKNPNFNYNDPQFLYDMENLAEKNEINNNNIPTNNFNNLDFQNFFGFDTKFLQNPNFNLGINPLNPLLNDKLTKNDFPNIVPNENVLNENFSNIKREEQDLGDTKNNIDFNQLLGGDPSMFFGFQPNPNNPNLLFELMNMNNMCNSNNQASNLNQQNQNFFDFESKNLMNNNNINNNQHQNQ